MHSPVRPSFFGELARAVERIDDPHPLGIEPDVVVGGLLGEDRVGGPLLAQAIRQQLLRPSIALVAECSTCEALGAHLSKEGAGVSGEGGSECVVVH